MCLLIVWHHSIADAPMVLAANRDELLARPATAMTVLREAAPRVLGGRDQLAGGTWLAVNEHGVFAGLTNLPLSRDPALRSRGELPLIAVEHRDARAAVSALCALRASEFNPCWLLVGDRQSLHYVDFTGGETAAARALEPGIHVLENRPLDAPSPKVDRVRALAAKRAPETTLTDYLRAILADHEVPSAPSAAARPIETEAACVHSALYGTRSSELIAIPESGAPRVWFTDGPPCTNPLHEATSRWTD